MAPLEDAGRIDDADGAQRVAGDAVCAAETEAQMWRLRCFEAQAQLRLLKQHRRGERHAQWPSTEFAVDELRERSRALTAKANSLAAGCTKPLRALVSARVQEQQLERKLVYEEDEIVRFELVGAQEEEALASFAEGREAEETSREARRQALIEEREQATSALTVVSHLYDELHSRQQELVSLTEQRDAHLQETSALQKDCELLEHAAESERPHLEQLADECHKVEATAERARTAAQKRTDSVIRFEQEVSEAVAQEEESMLQEQQALEDMRAEIRQLAESVVEMDDQARRARAGHARQVKAARDDAGALKSALADSEIEHGGIQEQVERARAVADSHAAGHEERQSRERGGAAVVEALRRDADLHTSRLETLVDEHEDHHTDHQAAEALLAEMLEEHGELNHGQIVSEASAAEMAVVNLESELALMREEYSIDACEQRAQRLASCHEELASAQQEETDLASFCESLRGRVAAMQEQMRERQLVARRGVLETAQHLKAVYAELLRDVRSGQARSTLEASRATNVTVRRTSRYVGDLLRFVEASCELPPEFSEESLHKTDGIDPVVSTTGPRLPGSIVEVFSSQYEKTEEGSAKVEQLNAEKHKVAMLRKKMLQASAQHAAQTERWSSQQNVLVDELSSCEQELEAERSAATEKLTALEQQLKEAGIRSTDSQMRAVVDIQNLLRVHSNELARLRSERAELQARRWGILAKAPSNDFESFQIEPCMPPMRLKAKEREILERRRRVSAAMARQEELVSEIGGREALEREGLVMPALQSRLMTSSSQAASPWMAADSPTARKPFVSSVAHADAAEVAEAIAKASGSNRPVASVGSEPRVRRWTSASLDSAAATTSRTPPTPVCQPAAAAALAAAANGRDGAPVSPRVTSVETSAPAYAGASASDGRRHVSEGRPNDGRRCFSEGRPGFSDGSEETRRFHPPQQISTSWSYTADALEAVLGRRPGISEPEVNPPHMAPPAMVRIQSPTSSQFQAPGANDFGGSRPGSPRSGTRGPRIGSATPSGTTPQVMQQLFDETPQDITGSHPDVDSASAGNSIVASQVTGHRSSPPTPGAAHKAALKLVASVSAAAEMGAPAGGASATHSVAAGLPPQPRPLVFPASPLSPSSRLDFVGGHQARSASPPQLRPTLLPPGVLLPAPARSASPRPYRHTVSTTSFAAPHGGVMSPRLFASPPRVPVDGRMVWASVSRPVYTASPRSSSPGGHRFARATSPARLVLPVAQVPPMQGRGLLVSWDAIANEALVSSPVRRAASPVPRGRTLVFGSAPSPRIGASRSATSLGSSASADPPPPLVLGASPPSDGWLRL